MDSTKYANKETLIKAYESTLHDIKTPVSIVQMSLQNLRALSGDWDQEALRALDLSIRHMESVAALLKNASERGLVPNFTEINLGYVINSSLQGIAPLADGDVSLSFDAEKADVSIITDKDLFERILQNLISNAIKAARGGRVEISVVLDQDQMVLEIADDGPGFKEEALSDLFARRDNPTGKISGIGLPITAEMARALGGSLSARNDAEGGAVMTLTLPLMKAFDT